MKVITRLFASTTALVLCAGLAHADSYSDTVKLFRNAGESASFFSKSYAYAVFPTVGAAGFIVGGARGDGRVYVHGKQVGDTTVTQVERWLSIGRQGLQSNYFLRG